MVRRRALLVGLAGTAGTAVAGTGSVAAGDGRQPAAALTSRLSALLTNPSAGTAVPLPLAAGGWALSAIRRDVQASRYHALADALPTVIDAALAARPTFAGGEAETADAHLAGLFSVAGEAMVKFGERGLAERAVARALVFAERAGDVLALAEAAQMRAVLARKAGRFSDAVAEVVRMADRIDGNDPLALSVRGSLWNTAGYTAARAGDRQGSRELLAAAAAAAGQLGGDGNWRHTAFGPTNVTFYRLGSADALGDPGEAIALARTVPVEAIPYAERRARFWLDVARAFDHWGKPDRCLVALLAAERSAPLEVRPRAVTRTLVARLMDGRRRIDAAGLRGLAVRVGLTP